ncbi:TlpA disulfide reductase family protein [Dokdonia sp. PRO95]|uniref:peroxiredoxin family protein n=1 Tax=Dokdonia sp. PRO95 TaxID=1239415 RepID=UPI0005538899|nr:TlpA disulfide reductase family protein [Dokdonia sp. PRO95]
MKHILILISFISIISCKQDKVVITPQTLNSGFWRATLAVQDQEELPFVFEVNDDEIITIYNAEERIEVDEIEINGDSIRIQTPVFEGYFVGRFRESGNQITGSFIKPSLDRVVPFTMNYGVKERFVSSAEVLSENTASVNVDGSWETVFSPDNAKDRYIAKGTFKSDGDIVTGTFRTTTGDYRYLEGKLDGDELRLSTFDGAHAFLFVATVTDSTMQGQFYSGNHFKEAFTAIKNNDYELPDAKGLTYLKEGYDRFDFSFKDTSGRIVSLQDEEYKDKVVLVQIMGSWCPNCLEESIFYRDYITGNPNENLKVVGLAFEYAKTEATAVKSINRLTDRLQLPYPVLLAQYGEGADKKKAAEKLPMLNHVLSYPTTIYIDKKGAVRRIHTGYNGTATGEKHLEFKEEFEKFIAQLLAE